jgi:hypothetical protein
MPAAGNLIRASDIPRVLDNGYAEITALSNTTTAGPVDTTGLSVTVDVVAGHRYRITFNGPGIQSSVTGDVGQISITDGAGTRLTGTGRVEALFSNSPCNGGALIATDLPTTGSKTYKVRHERISGTGNVGVGADATRPAFIMVELIS